MARKKSNWDFLQKQRLGDSVKHRDVYEDQQLERTRIKEKQTFTLRVIFMLICSLIVGGVVYAIAGAIQFGYNWMEHGKQVNVVGEFSKPEDVLLVNGKALNYTKSGSMTVTDEKGEEVRKIVWIPLDENGERIGKEVYEKREDVPYPDWVNTKLLEKENPDTKSEEARKILVGELSFEEAMAPDLKQIVAAILAGMICYLIMTPFMKRNLAAQNLMSDTSDINQYQNDQHIMLPEEMQEKFDWFPDVGAHSSVQVSSMISHIAILNKGLKKVKMAKRAKKDILDEDGGVEYYKGEILLDENGEPILYEVPIIDIDFMEDLFEASGAPKDKAIRKYYDTTKINYNKDNKDREKLKGYDTVADLINGDWELPYYETQRPGGAYIVDTAPVNTMVLAITRAGKGQTVIEPTIDMWLREKNPNNMVVNDPKGELLVKNYVKATVRGFQPIQFNLINAMKTDIYNPLSMAADAAREGDFTKCALYVENIADVFFPVDGGDDPVWPNAANNAFKRAAYGLIDYYLEEEKELRLFAEKTKMEDKILENQLDAMWGKVTLYNCYQLFVQLTSKKLKNPAVEFTKEVKAGKYNSLSDDEYADKLEKIEAEAKLWEDRPEIDMLTLFFNATAALPKNQMRTLISNADNSLKAMAGAEKMLASVYGIAITAMSFFTDPTISTLTSGTPSQNVDLAGLSFPRRIGVKFHPAFIERYHLTGLQVKWQAYEDINFEKKMSKDFYHEDLVTREGWAKYYFKGIFPEDTAYLKLEIVNPQTGFLVKTLYFKFVKSYQTSLSGKTYVKDPVLGEKIVKNGLLTELRQVKNKETGEIIFKKGKTTFPSVKMKDIETQPHKDKVNAHAIVRTMVRYSEKPKTVFLVTPPHLMKYAKLILILIKQLVDLNFDQSYMTKANQKPLYKTRFMLDELGNLQSEGHGISGFETMLSIGLGQEQQFTLILQTLQQLRDVYGESVDKIVQGNAQPLTALIATSAGWTKMGDIKVGDKVLTPFGTETTVTGVYPKGVRPVFGITTKDGAYTEACDEHLWNFSDSNEEKVVGTTLQMLSRLDKGVSVYLPKLEPIIYEWKSQPIDPYVMGVILAGGSIYDGKPCLKIYDDNRLVKLNNALISRGYQLWVSYGEKHWVGGQNSDTDLQEALSSLGMSNVSYFGHFIPDCYKYGSLEQRKQLVSGIMDTRGLFLADRSGLMDVSTYSEQYFKDLQQVIRSLGGLFEVHSFTPDKNYKDWCKAERRRCISRTKYTLKNIVLKEYPCSTVDLFRENYDSLMDNYSREVVSIEYVRDDEVQCICVEDERHLYITDNYIPTHNTSNIVFLKSTDDSMLDTLQKMSGTTHRSFTDSKTVTRDAEKVILQTEGKVSYTMTTREVPVISYNDMAFISERNSIVFRAGDSPIWNRNETILPMSWRLFKDTITQPGKEYTLQTIPTLSSAKDFDVRKNQPNFGQMLEKRKKQAIAAELATEVFQSVYDYTDYQMEQLDPDVKADEIMEVINTSIREEIGEAAEDEYDYFDYMEDEWSTAEENTEQIQITAQIEATYKSLNDKIYAEGMLSRASLMGDNGIPQHSFDNDIIAVYNEVKSYMWKDTGYFRYDEANGVLYGINGLPYIIKERSSASLDVINKAAESEDTRVFGEEPIEESHLNALGTFRVTDDFYRFLTSLSSWDFANRMFEREMAKRMKNS